VPLPVAVHTVAEAIANVALTRVEDPPGSKRVRVEDYLTALGAITGESAIVDAGIDIEALDIAPGSALFGDGINAVLTGDKTDLAEVPSDSIVGILVDQLVPHVVALADFGSIQDLYRSVAASVGQTEWGEVHLTVPEDNRPRIPPIRLAFELRPTVESACLAAGLVSGDRHRACALALAGGLVQVAGAIDIKVGLRLALEVVFGMAKMAPMSQGAFDKVARES
jgi:hypothetical protein